MRAALASVAVLFVVSGIWAAITSQYADAVRDKALAEGRVEGRKEALSDISTAAMLNYVNCISDHCQRQRDTWRDVSEMARVLKERPTA